MTQELKDFLESIPESDYMGKRTKKSLQRKAKMYLNSEHYEYNDHYYKCPEGESVLGWDVHNSLLCLIYDQI